VLNDAKVKAAKPKGAAYKLGDAEQLYLLVTKAGGRHWRWNYTYGKNPKGKPAQKTLALGSYPSTSLGEARELRNAAKKLLRDGKDPAVEKRLAIVEQETASANTFETVALRWFELNSGWSVERFRAWQKETGEAFSRKAAPAWIEHRTDRWSLQQGYDILRSLERDIFPHIGELPIASLKPPKVLKVLQETERRGAIETAHRLRQRVSAVFSYGISAGLCESDPAAKLGQALKTVPKETPQPSIVDGIAEWDGQVTAFRQMMIDCEALRRRAVTKLALRFLALTCVRPGELAGAMWKEFEDLEPRFVTIGATPMQTNLPLWRIPALRMKGDSKRKAEAGGDHLVPLSRQAVDVLQVLRRLTGRFPYCFPGERTIQQPISDNTLRKLLMDAGYKGRHVPHGFRSAFSTIMNERPKELKHDDDRAVVDLMLAHIPEQKSGSEGAYNRAAYMARRRELAQEWADLIFAGFWPADIHLGQPMRFGRRMKRDLQEIVDALAG
jgi:integrase